MNANKSVRRSLSLAVSLVSLAITAPAFAGDAAAAEALFNEARKLMSQGNFTAACPQLEESQKLDPGMGTLYNLGDCYEKTGKVASAWAAFLDVAAQAKAAGQAPREADARARAAALEPKLSRLTIAVDGPVAATEGIAIKRDGIAVGKAQWGLSLPVDPGEHQIEISAPNKKTRLEKLLVSANGANARFTVPALEDAPAGTGPGPSASPAQTHELSAPASDTGKTQRTIGLVVGGVGIVGMGVGAVFGLSSMSKKSDGDAECKFPGGLCTQKGVDARSDAQSAGNLSTVFFVVGGLATAGGVVLYLTAPKGNTSASLVPVAHAGGGGLMLQGGFQ